MGLPIELNRIYWDSMGFNQQKLRIYRELMGLKPIQYHCVCVFCFGSYILFISHKNDSFSYSQLCKSLLSHIDSY